MAFQNKGIRFPHGIRQRPQGDGSCDICGSPPILSPRIHQQKSFRIQRCAGGFLRRVVHNGSIGIIPYDGVKAGAQASFCFRAKCIQILRRHGFSDLSWLPPHRLFHPPDKTDHGSAIFSMRLPYMRLLNRIFQRLHPNNRIPFLLGGPQHRNRLSKALVQLLRIIGNTALRLLG